MQTGSPHCRGPTSRLKPPGAVSHDSTQYITPPLNSPWQYRGSTCSYSAPRAAQTRAMPSGAPRACMLPRSSSVFQAVSTCLTVGPAVCPCICPAICISAAWVAQHNARDARCPDRLFMDRLFMDRLFMDRLFMDRLFMDRLFMDRLFMDRLFMDRLFMDRLCMWLGRRGVHACAPARHLRPRGRPTTCTGVAATKPGWITSCVIGSITAGPALVTVAT